MQIHRITNEGRVVSRVRAPHPNAAPHAWKATAAVDYLHPLQPTAGN